MTVWFLTIFIILTLLPFIYWFYIIRKHTKSDIPGPKPFPIIGNFLEFHKSATELLPGLLDLTKKYGPTIKLWLGYEWIVLTTKPEHVEYFMKSSQHITKSDGYELVKPWLGNGLLVSSGSKWRSRRKMITPAFHFKILDKFVDIFDVAANNLVEKLKIESVLHGSIDICPFISMCSLDVICETSMGVSLRAQNESQREYVIAVKDFLYIVGKRMFSLWKRNKILFKLSSYYKKYTESLRIMHNFTNKVIMQRRKEFDKNKFSYEDFYEKGFKRKVALLDMLLIESENHFLSDEDIREEIDTFMFEGHDTISSAISFALYEISRHPQVQKAIYKEIQSVFGSDRNIKITYRNLQEMKYLERVLKEVERLYPSVPVIGRLIQNDCDLDNYKITKGTQVVIFIYGLHRSQSIYENPDKFDPDRFIPENQSKLHNYSFIPFSAGPRNCIGQKFAVLEMKAAVIRILQNFELFPVLDVEMKVGYFGILKSCNGVHVKLKCRS